MVSWTKLLTGKLEDNDTLRYCKGNSNAPRIVVWNTTSRCNLRCQHCYFDARQAADPNELNQKEAEDLIDDLAKLRVSMLLFSGGEPLLRKGIFSLGRFARDRGIQPVLSTNGTLITEEIAAKIKAAGFSYVGISLDGLQETNDTFRQNRGAFKASVNAIKNCQKAGLKVGLRFTITKCNIKDLPDVFDLVEKLSIPRFCIYHLVYAGRGSNKGNDITHKERRQMLELIWQKTLHFCQNGLKTEILTVDNHADGVWIYLKLKKRNPKRAKEALELLKAQGGNSSGIKMAAVDDQGYIYADQFLRKYPLGNTRQNRFSDVWQNERNDFLQVLRNRSSLIKGRCQRCNFMLLCNGNFRARAEASSGEIWSEDPACYLTEKEIKSSLN